MKKKEKLDGSNKKIIESKNIIKLEKTKIRMEKENHHFQRLSFDFDDKSADLKVKSIQNPKYAHIFEITHDIVSSNIKMESENFNQ